MKFKKIFILFLLFFSLLFVRAYATEFSSSDSKTVDIDITKIAETFNKSSYVSKFSSIGIKVSAVQTNNSIILNYGNTDSITYAYDSDKGIYTTSYSVTPIHEYLNALLVNTIYTMQGNEEGVQVPFALDDTMSFAGIRDTGYEKSYIADNQGNPQIKFQINPSMRLKVSSNSSPISDTTLMLNGTIYGKEDFITRSGDLIFFRTYNADGLLELYIGQPTELNNLSYDSILTALSIIFSNGSELNNTVMTYLKQNYSDFSLGNADFSGVSIDTSVTDLPIQNGDTILVSPNMKYAKVTIDETKVKEELSNVVVDNPKAGDSTKISKNRLSSPLVIASVIISSVLIIMLVGVLIRKNQSLD